MDIIYEKKQFYIFYYKSGFIVVNKNKIFEEGHTHLKSLEKAKHIIDLVLNKKIDRRLGIRLLQSCARISENVDYINKIELLIEVKRNKGKRECYKRECCHK